MANPQRNSQGGPRQIRAARGCRPQGPAEDSDQGGRGVVSERDCSKNNKWHATLKTLSTPNNFVLSFAFFSYKQLLEDPDILSQALLAIRISGENTHNGALTCLNLRRCMVFQEQLCTRPSRRSAPCVMCSIPSAHKLLPSKLFFEIILSGNPKNYRN